MALPAPPPLAFASGPPPQAQLGVNEAAPQILPIFDGEGDRREAVVEGRLTQRPFRLSEVEAHA